MSTDRPIVRFHCFPALAIRFSSLSPSTDLRRSGGARNMVEFTASSVDCVAPEKNAWMLYISLYDEDSGMKCTLRTDRKFSTDTI